MNPPIPNTPAILTTTVGSYPVPDWLTALPSEQALIDATRVVLSIQENAGIDLPTDGELYRFDINHPDTNGMIEYFIRPLTGIRTNLGRKEWEEFQTLPGMTFRSKPAGVVTGPLSDGGLNLAADCRRVAALTKQPFKFTVTSPYMLAKSLLDKHFGDFERLLMRLAEILGEQVADLPCSCLQVDEANITGCPEDGPLAARAINHLLAAASGAEKAVHLCFGNYAGQTVQRGTWIRMIDFLNRLSVDHLVMEMAHRPTEEIEVLREIDERIRIGIGVIDVKVNAIETPDCVARRIEHAMQVLGPGRLRWVHPDCGFWMLKRSVADRKIEAMVKGRDLFLG